MHACEVGDRISVIIVLANSCVILTVTLMYNPLSCVLTVFLKRNMHLSLWNSLTTSSLTNKLAVKFSCLEVTKLL